MLKYLNTQVTFSEVPDEITLCINITGCKIGCKNCHSSYLAEDIGTPLNERELEHLIKENKGITCVSFMGGDINPIEIESLAKYIKSFYPELKVSWYSGKQELPKHFNVELLDFIKLGPYIEELGPLTNKNTNQRFYEIKSGKLNDITNKFYKNE